MTIGAELRNIRDSAVNDAKQKIKDWFEEHMNELRGAAFGGADCIIYNDEENFKFFKKLFDENKIILDNFCSEQSIEIEFGQTTREVVISWNELFTEDQNDWKRSV